MPALADTVQDNDLGELNQFYSSPPPAPVNDDPLAQFYIPPDTTEHFASNDSENDPLGQFYIKTSTSESEKALEATPRVLTPRDPADRQRAIDNRSRLQTTAERLGIPHFIGSKDEPEGDRAPTIDMENVVAELKRREAVAPDQDKPGIAKERSYWENEVATSGMSAEQWKRQTGEDDPVLPKVPPQVQDIFSQSDAQQQIEKNAPVTAPAWMQNAASAAMETLSGFVPKSPGDVAKLLTPIATLPEDAKRHYQALRDVIQGVPIAEAEKRNFPESQIFVEAEKTPAFSKERFKAAFGTLARFGMIAGGVKSLSTPGHISREPTETVLVRPSQIETQRKDSSVVPSSPEIIPPGAGPQTLETKLPVTEGGEIVASAVPAATEPGTPAAEINAALNKEAVPEVTLPEHLRRDPEIDRLLDNPEAQTGPQMKFEPATEGGAFGSGGGKRPTTKPKGVTPRGDTEFLKIDPGYKRVFSGLEREGAADVIGGTRNKVGQKLATAAKRHVDTEQELFGQLSSEFGRVTRGAGSTEVLNKAFDEVTPYLAAKENGRPLPTLSPTATKLVTAWENVAEQTGKIAAGNNVQVFDPVLGKHRPMHIMGRKYVPRMLKPEVEQVMRDPNSSPKLWNDLVDELAKHRGITDAEAANALRAESSRFQANDFMGNLEMARTGKLPEVFYDYDLRNVASRYIPAFSERMSQIISYGQRLGPRESPVKPNLWDVARNEAADSFTQDWLTSAENQAVNLKLKGAAATGMARAQTAASGLLLSSPTTTVMRNLLSGVSATPELLGIRRSVGALVKTATDAHVRMDAREIGAVRDNIGDFLHADRLGDSPVDNAIRATVDAGLKYSGYNGSEVFVRSHGALTASQFAKDGVASILKNPASMRSKEALALFKRMGADAEKIVAEKAEWKTGPETRKFIRTVIRDTQGGYRFDQVPLWANSNMGRFFYQFGRWGTQRSRNIWNNGVKPALGEEVAWKGKTMTRRDVRPLLKMLGGTVVLGETFAGIAHVLFGRDRRDASLSEIAAAWGEDEKKAVGLAFERMINDVIMAGTLGIWSQPIDWAKGFKDQSRLKNPTNPPGLGSINALTELGQDAIDQGTVTRRDLLKFASSLAPGVKQVSDVARNVMDEPLYEAENDVRTLRAAATRWAKGAGLDVAPRAKGDFRKSAMAPTYEPIKEALLVGDSVRASFLAKEFLDTQPSRKDARKSLKASVKQSQPFRAGPYTAKTHRDDFKIWAKAHLSEDDLNQTERVQERYMRAAKAAGLW